MSKERSDQAETAEFFDSISCKYDEVILRCVPRYDEMLEMIFKYLPKARNYSRILELGCGSGNLSEVALSHFPNCKFVAVDISNEQVDLTKTRLANVHGELSAQVEILCADFRDLDFADESFDLIISSISIHHLLDSEKQALFQNGHRWLSANGLMCYSDQFKGQTDEIYQTHIAQWKKFTEQKGASAEEWQVWMDHQDEHDHHAKLGDQMAWLSSAGFHNVDCVWRHLLWTVLIAEK